MADKEIVAAKISIDTGQANANVVGLNKNLKETRSTLKEVGAESKGTSSEILGSSQSFGKLKDAMAGLPGPLGAATEGAGKLQIAFRALLANPIVLIISAIVVGLTALYKWFSNTYEGGQKLEQVFAGIKAAGQALLDNLGKVASLIKNVFTFNFSGAIDDIKGIADAAVDAFDKMSKLTAEAQKLAIEQSDNDLDQVKRQAELAKLREQATGDDVPVQKRKEALLELRKQSEENAKADIELAKRIADNKIAQLTLEKDGAKKNYIEIQKIRADQLKGEIDNANELRSINKQINSIEKQEHDEWKARQDERIAKLKQQAEELKKLKSELEKELAQRGINEQEKELLRIQELHDERVRRARGNAEALLLIQQLYYDQLRDLDNKYNAPKKIEAEQAVTDETARQSVLKGVVIDTQQGIQNVLQSGAQSEAQIAADREERFQRHQQNLGAIGDATTKLGEIVGKQTAAGKAMGIATSIINTWVGVTEVLRAKSVLPEPAGTIAKIVNVAAVIASGIKAVKEIVKTPVPGGGGGGSAPSAPSITPAAPLAPTQQSTRIDQQSLSQIGNATVRAYVLDSDAVNNRERNERLNRAARLGG